MRQADHFNTFGIHFHLVFSLKIIFEPISCYYCIRNMPENVSTILHQGINRLYWLQSPLNVFFLVSTTHRTFDKDQNGYIDFTEFLLAIDVTSAGSATDRLKWAFR